MPMGNAVACRYVCILVVAVVVAFVVCWAPFHAQRLLTIYTRDDQWTDTLLETQSVLFYISGKIIAPKCYKMYQFSTFLGSWLISIN